MEKWEKIHYLRNNTDFRIVIGSLKQASPLKSTTFMDVTTTALYLSIKWKQFVQLKSDTDTARATFLRHRSLDIIETPPAKKH
jgi:hypothetical protein